MSATVREPTVCVVLHDAAPSTQKSCARVLAAVRQVVGEAPVTILAVPRYHGQAPSAEFEAWLGERARRGDELALHGCTHLDEGRPESAIDALRRSHYTRGEGEFWSLSRREALARIDLGIAWFAKHRWPLSGFVAPAWLLGEAAREALVQRPFEYTATLRQLIHLPSQVAIGSQSIVYSTSSGWRRQLSLAWNAGVDLLERRNALLRIELHPRDADFAAVRRSWQRILARALHKRRPATVAEFMRSSRQRDSTTVF
ncbi:MAG: polysaccharide deacetylase family protein [Rhizobacter sp.]|nr:polysaccharide deacetylase family protein [Rhizobacter sp.]